ncbi:MAG: FAD:protein FMN transferase [Spirochaetales bacterium]|nr:FAD:protein FMN transferase [Spirochaetales bacterium]
MSKRRTLTILILLLASLALTGCSKGKIESSGPRSKVLYSFFDTVTLVYSYADDDESSFEKNVFDVENTLREYHMMMDIYNEYEGMNNLCTVNRNAGGDPVKVDRRLVDFLLYAKDLCKLTDNRLDIMMGSVLSLWHDARSAEVQYLPSDEKLKEAGKHMGLGLLEIDENACTVRITDPEASIDVGAIGKGYATEMAAKTLEKKGVSGYVINVGGNLRCIGTKADGSFWVAGIRDPKNPENLALTVSIADCSCVTSGSYERYLEVDGVRYSHIIDRDTLYPSDRFGSTTVITKDSGLADALATALFCMDYDQGRALVDSLEGVQCIWIEKDGTVRRTDGI